MFMYEGSILTVPIIAPALITMSKASGFYDVWFSFDKWPSLLAGLTEHRLQIFFLIPQIIVLCR